IIRLLRRTQLITVNSFRAPLARPRPYPLSLHDALPICRARDRPLVAADQSGTRRGAGRAGAGGGAGGDRRASARFGAANPRAHSTTLGARDRGGPARPRAGTRTTRLAVPRGGRCAARGAEHRRG